MNLWSTLLSNAPKLQHLHRLQLSLNFQDCDLENPQRIPVRSHNKAVVIDFGEALRPKIRALAGRCPCLMGVCVALPDDDYGCGWGEFLRFRAMRRRREGTNWGGRLDGEVGEGGEGEGYGSGDLVVECEVCEMKEWVDIGG